ncbi:hypothetical protein XEUV354_03285 [Xanthomonas euvesicatoria]|nr:hypothetical protein BHE83_05910 [Xanthomonas euvesicatoria pv. vesicatoria str. 85-10]APO90273.1 hypothetical protein BJD11_09635 [Xanthomonas euvesicatoria]OHX24246.1 hypothetical protein BHL63_18295 [Xanthomonas alfalfae]TKA20401.1 hypothetical protein TP41_03110 [Xanthomonas euvesicatoria pv. citrumelonis]KHL51503.1 hypothetical protein XEU66b_23290 [Xanthomonas euvesicatoria]
MHPVWLAAVVLANTVLQQFQAIVTRPELAGV